MKFICKICGTQLLARQDHFVCPGCGKTWKDKEVFPALQEKPPKGKRWRVQAGESRPRLVQLPMFEDD